MNSRPLILVAPSTQKAGAEFYDYSISVSQAYLEALLAAGALPLVLPCAPIPDILRDYIALADGVMLTGGDDIQPGLYTRALSPQLTETVGDTDPARDLQEVLLVKEIVKQAKPLLAICRGHQILNIALGGSLFVDIGRQVEGAIKHCRMDKKDEFVHRVTLLKDSRLAAIFQREKIEVNSSHHQAVSSVAPALRPTATSSDGIIEALELKPESRGMLPYLLAVQFHPERLVRKYPEFLQMFRDFVQACSSSPKKL